MTNEMKLIFVLIHPFILSMVTWQDILVTSAYLKSFPIKSPAVTYLQKVVSETHLMRLQIFL